MTIATSTTVSGYAGDSIVLNVAVLDSSGNPYNLTGVSAITYELAEGFGQPALVTKSLGSGISVTSAVSGLYTINLADTDTETFSGNYAQASRFTDTSGNVNTVFCGIITLVPTPYF